MQTLGIITEYNPLHYGHAHLINRLREQLGSETAVICVMSGNFVQRGDFAIMDKHSRAAAAVHCGVDLVVELPLPYATAAAADFARGAVETLVATGLLTHLGFGSECGDSAALEEAAVALDHAHFPALLKQALSTGVSFPTAREQALRSLLGEKAALLSTPNNALAISYCQALQTIAPHVNVVTIPRIGAAHDGDTIGNIASASGVRRLIEAGQDVSHLLPPPMATALEQAITAGHAPVLAETCQRGILAKLRTMTLDDYRQLDTSNEGLYHRFYRESRTATSLEGLLSAVKTKRYPYARLRRMALWGYLGISPQDIPDAVPYIRILAANGRGRTLLSQMRATATVPILTKPADVSKLSDQAQRLFQLEATSTDLYTLAYPDLSQAQGGQEWRQGPVMIE
ncbi:nucleotidyltransferase family protein [Bengtsoniella intestinalis]|uniref:tRNA(Met) cytidine acetate ligase n=1 Tax=Bengtsoniella intestinalis TaxID=3073143 RepID=UPI00391FBDBD